MSNNPWDSFFESSDAFNRPVTQAEIALDKLSMLPIYIINSEDFEQFEMFIMRYEALIIKDESNPYYLKLIEDIEDFAINIGINLQICDKDIIRNIIQALLGNRTSMEWSLFMLKCMDE